jgi:hypothetical protein
LSEIQSWKTIAILILAGDIQLGVTNDLNRRTKVVYRATYLNLIIDTGQASSIALDFTAAFDLDGDRVCCMLSWVNRNASLIVGITVVIDTVTQLQSRALLHVNNVSRSLQVQVYRHCLNVDDWLVQMDVRLL